MRVGFIVNPIAGMGGKTALKGTDGEDILRRALRLGAVPGSSLRAELAVKEFFAAAAGHQFLTASGEMGERLLDKYGLNMEVVRRAGARTTSNDTVKAAAAVLEKRADLLVFAGGDGTARDICSVVGESIPVIGIPSGVKLYSGVYATRPREAGLLIRNFMLARVRKYIEAEVMDIDERAFRNNIVKTRLYGYMKVPDDRKFMQNRKTGGAGNDIYEIDAIAARVIEDMREGSLYLLGSGSTMARIKERMGLKATLLGVDAVENKRLLARDVNENEIISILERYEKQKRYLILTLIGGQGHIFGRGNQQISPEVLRRLPGENISIVAAPSKIAQMFGRPLISDTGDAGLDDNYSGYAAVITGYSRKVMVKII